MPMHRLASGLCSMPTAGKWQAQQVQASVRNISLVHYCSHGLAHCASRIVAAYTHTREHCERLWPLNVLSQKTKSLGVIIDDHLRFDAHCQLVHVSHACSMSSLSQSAASCCLSWTTATRCSTVQERPLLISYSMLRMCWHAW